MTRRVFRPRPWRSRSRSRCSKQPQRSGHEALFVAVAYESAMAGGASGPSPESTRKWPASAPARRHLPGKAGGPWPSLTEASWSPTTTKPAWASRASKHVAQHFQANRPRRSPAVSAKLLDAAPTLAERFREHLRAESGALGQSRAGLLRRAVRAAELSRNLQVRSCKPDPLGADIVHVREDGRNGAGFAGRFGSPGGRIQLFDKPCIDAWSRLLAP
jgi:hypothetical protein